MSVTVTIADAVRAEERMRQQEELAVRYDSVKLSYRLDVIVSDGVLKNVPVFTFEAGGMSASSGTPHAAIGAVYTLLMDKERA